MTSPGLRTGSPAPKITKTKETFQNNNSTYAGEIDGIHVTLLENNHVDPSRPDAYEAVFFYLTRQDGKLFMHTERHVLGLFSRTAWQRIFRDAGDSPSAKRFSTALTTGTCSAAADIR